jgi:hypothetical protein
VRDDNFPHPVSDPEADGLPGTADDDSSAGDDVETGRIADGPDPAALPLDRDDGPLAIDRYGTTAEEARIGEPLDLKLAGEEPDPALLDVGERADAAVSPGSGEMFDPEPIDSGLDAPEDETSLDVTGPVDPHRDSPVSMYDTGIGGSDGTVGRLVEPDEGVRADVDKDAIAYDTGAAGGGATAEELAMHEIPET